jgi:hypothetical protein
MAAKKKANTAKSAAPQPKGAVRFEATVEATSVGRAILRLPAPASKQLPSRGQVAVDGLVGGHAFQTVVEPDGDFGHWMSLDPELQAAIGLGPGDTASVQVEPSSAWPEPEVPKDLKKALSAAPTEVRELWTTITPMARWEWVRWGQRDQGRGHAAAARGGQHLEAERRQAAPVLLQPGGLHRPRPREERKARRALTRTGGCLGTSRITTG